MEILSYLLKVSIGISFTCMIYYLFFSRLKFFTWNRWFLLSFFLLSFLWPLLNFQQNIFGLGLNKKIAAYNFTIDSNASSIKQPVVTENILLIIFFTGLLYFLIRFLYGLVQLSRQTATAKMIKNKPVAIFLHNKKGSYTWGRKIFMGTEVQESTAIDTVIAHELAHVRQAHFIDIYLTQLCCMLTWFNPFSWKLRRAVLQNLEFLADEAVIQSGIQVGAYQLEMVKLASTNIPAQFPAFSAGFYSLKKRILMLNKNATSPLQKFRFLLILPAIVIMLMVFSFSSDVSVNGITPLVVSDTIPASKTQPYEKISAANDIITVTLKNGKQEKYNMKNKAERETYMSKYPPPPPTPPVKKKEGDKPAPPPPPRPPDVNKKQVPDAPIPPPVKKKEGDKPAPPPPPRPPDVNKKQVPAAPIPPPVKKKEGDKPAPPPPPRPPDVNKKQVPAAPIPPPVKKQENLP